VHGRHKRPCIGKQIQGWAINFIGVFIMIFKYLPRSLMATALTLTAMAAQSQTVVKIAVVGPLTGSSAHYGKDNERGAQLAIDDLNRRQFKIAGKTAQFELISEDDQANVKQALLIAQKLVVMKVNGVVGHNNSGTTIPAAKIYNEAGLVHITPAATNPQLTRLGYASTFRTIAHDGLLGNALAVHAIVKLKLRDITIIDDGTSYGQGLAQEFEKTLQSFGGRVVLRQTTTDKTTDFSALLTQVKAANPQVIFYGGLDSQAGPMLQQLKALGLGHIPFMGGDGLCTAELTKLGGTAVGSQVICADGGEALNSMAKGPEFARRYKEKYGSDVVVNAPFAYDNVMLLAQAMKTAGSTDPRKYRDALSKIKYSDAITGTIEFDGSGQRKKAAVTLSTYPAGVKTVLKAMR
jgi:branched-chain amino acid transport system substrate-binding protein